MLGAKCGRHSPNAYRRIKGDEQVRNDSKWTESRGQTQHPWAHAPALPGTGYLTLSNSLKFLELSFPQLYHMNLCRELRGTIMKTSSAEPHTRKCSIYLADIIMLEGNCDLRCHHHTTPGVGNRRAEEMVGREGCSKGEPPFPS